jgi:hypothetical protein
MFDFFETLIQVLLSMALLYGVVIAFRNWNATVPRGAESDAEYAHHGRLELRGDRSPFPFPTQASLRRSEVPALCTSSVTPTALALHWFAATERRHYRVRFPQALERRHYI